MKVYIKILKFAGPYKFFIMISIIASIFYVFTNGVSLWIIGSLLSSVMNGGSLLSNNNLTFTEKINDYIFYFIDMDNKVYLFTFKRGQTIDNYAVIKWNIDFQTVISGLFQINITNY